MSRPALWTAIVETLDAEIGSGRYAPGDRLPTEAALAQRFGVNRHTVRRALGDLSARGLVVTRRGAGAFAARPPTEYRIGRRTRMQQNLAANGQFASRQTLLIETRAADPREAEALALTPGSAVHVYEGLSFADGTPLGLFRSVFDATRFPDLAQHLGAESSITRALGLSGLADYTRAATRVTAKLATPTQARHLRVSPGAPILRSVALNVDLDGCPVEYGHTWFAGDRITLTLAPE